MWEVEAAEACLARGPQVIRQQLHVGHDLLLVFGKQQQQMQTQTQTQQQQTQTQGVGADRVHLHWEEAEEGARVQSFAVLPALLTTPCLHAPMEVRGCDPAEQPLHVPVGNI